MKYINKQVRYTFLNRYLGGYIEEISKSERELHKDEEMRFLIVEDDEAILKSLVDELRERGYVVYGTKDPREIPNLVIRTKPNVFVMDYYLPVSDGAQLIKDLSREESFMGAAFVLMSAYPSVREAAADGGVRYLEKPFDISTLLREVESARRQGVERVDQKQSKVAMLVDDTKDLARKVKEMLKDVP